MIAVNHPGMGAQIQEGGSRSLPVFEHIIMQPSPIREVAPPFAPAQGEPPPTVPQSEPPVETGEMLGPGETSAVSPASSALPIQVSSIVDPVTGVTYAGYLTQDAQALYNSGSLLTGGNVLTPQGSALAAQGDLIQGTPAPNAAQIAQPAASAPTTDAFSSIETWLSSETLIPGYPNGLVTAAAVIATAWLFGGKKRRR